MTDKKKRSPGELLEAIHRMSVEDEQNAVLEMSDDEVSAELATLTDEKGNRADPKAIGERGAAFALAEIAHQKKLAEWRALAEGDLLRALTAIDAVPKTPPLPRKELEERIDRAVRRSPDLREPVQVAFKKRKREAASEHELRTFLDALERLEALRAVLDGGKKKD